MAKFTEEQKEELHKDVDKGIIKWEGISKNNQLWDILFKVAILLISISIAVCSVLAAAEEITNTQPWSIAATILAAISAALSGFAFSQFNFAARQQVWRSKANALRELGFCLSYLDPEIEEWGRLRMKVASWNDNTSIEQTILVGLLSKDIHNN